MRFLVVPFVLLASVARANSLLLELRGDLDSVTANEAAGIATSSAFTLQTARFDFKGDINESLSYRMRLKANDEGTSRGVDAVSSRFDQGYLTHKMDAVSVTLGKFGIDAGGFETVADSFNLYFASKANEALNRNFTGAANTYFTPIKYSTGAKVAYRAGAHELTLMIFNNPASDAGTPKAQTRFFGGAVYKGAFAGSKLSAILSYHSGNSPVETVGGTAYIGEGAARLSAAGLKWTESAWWAQLDAVDLKSVDLNAADLTSMSVRSVVAELGFVADAWTIRPKIEMSRVNESPTVAAETKTNFEGGAIGVEYRPFADKNFRYHFAATQRATKVDGLDDRIENRVIAGFAFSADLLK